MEGWSAPVVRLAPVVEVVGAARPLLRVKLSLDRHQVVTHTQRPQGEAVFPAFVSIVQTNAGEHVPPAETEKTEDEWTRVHVFIIISCSLRSSPTGPSYPMSGGHVGLANTAPWWAWYYQVSCQWLFEGVSVRAGGSSNTSRNI